MTACWHGPTCEGTGPDCDRDTPTWGSATHHKREMRPLPNRRRKCRCGCGGPATHAGTANNVGLIVGCEWTVRRWVHDQDQKALAKASLSDSPEVQR